MVPRISLLCLFVGITSTVSAFGGDNPVRNFAPAGLRVMSTKAYDGKADDLLTGGTGTALPADASAVPPIAYADPTKPTAAELRRAALRSAKYNAGDLQGISWGSNIDPATGQVVAGDGKISGTEILAFQDDGTGRKNTAMVLQIPASFDLSNPCILVVSVTSNTRIYTGSSPAWGLRRNCAVVQTDKLGGNGIHELTTNTVLQITGEIANADAIGTDSHFTAPLSAADRMAYVAKYPNRVAVKPFSKRNTFAAWGPDIVSAARFAYYCLNEMYGKTLADGSKEVRFNKANTVTILTGTSSGGGGAIMGAEADTEGLIGGVVAMWPQVQPQANSKAIVKRAGYTYVNRGIVLADHQIMTQMYMTCATQADPTAPAFSAITHGPSTCASLKQRGMLTATTVLKQAAEARDILIAYGYDPASLFTWPTNANGHPLGGIQSILSAFGSFGIEDNLCNFTSAYQLGPAGKPRAPTPTELATMWLNLGGYSPKLVYEDSVGGAINYVDGISPTTGLQDYSMDGALCLRNLLTGNSPEALRVQAGARQTLATGDTHGKAVLIVQGREDTRLPPTLTARAYLALNNLVEGNESRVRYVELTNTYHGPAGGALAPYTVAPLYYEWMGLNLMYDHLKNKSALPANQVIHTVPRGTSTALTTTNMPPIAITPTEQNAIVVLDGVVTIPD